MTDQKYFSNERTILMRSATLASLVLALGWLCAVEARAIDTRLAAKPDAQLSLDTAIPAAIDLVERKEYETLVLQFVRPADLKKFKEKGKLKEIVAGLGEKKAERMLKALRACQELTPRLEEDGTKAIYVFKEKIDHKGQMTWERVDGRWYIAD